ncbi:PorT family protein [Paracrocinitomix mangrovi]|uniref:PorT family protein n=1 Tax=Paracrocinitomix mangrovi TaxID=2862509 RepID=UPI001C8EE4C6|nr:PorT family protein [Paracrocinitomix mangrovi]UKN01464.1 PorT family protein [Paracrocinitomix mangrovi]
MKHLFTIAFVLIVGICNAQLWFDVGAKAGIGAGFPMNKTLNDDSRLNIGVGMNYFFGGKVGINFGEYVGLTCDVDYGKYNFGFNQSEIPGFTSTESYKYKFGYNALGVMPMFRFTKEMSYLEIGPQFLFASNQYIEDEAGSGVSPTAEELIDSRMTGVTFGFGAHMIGNEIISLMMGLRFNYVFSGITSDTYEATNYPFSNYYDITSANKTSPINAQIVLEVNYSLGYIARSTTSCGKRAAFLTF